MTLAHIMGMPVEESALALAPAGAAILTGAAIIARAKLAAIVAGLRRRERAAELSSTSSSRRDLDPHATRSGAAGLRSARAKQSG
jgi:hypothetical protein